MSEILTRLGNDHATTAWLLDAFERELDAFERGETPDYPFISDMLAYFRGYPDRFHHPLEEAVAAVLLRRRPDVASAVTALGEDHERVSRLLKTCSDVIERVLQDQELPRDLFERTAREFLDFYRRHLHWEEEAIFPPAREALTAADWRELEHRLAEESDPLHGRSAAERYEVLRRGLMAPDGGAG